MIADGMTSVLDNVVWHAITGPRAALAERLGDAGRFHPDVSPFAAVADRGSASAWADLAALVGPGRRTVVFAPPSFSVPDGWTQSDRVPCAQLVADRCVPVPTDGFVPLGTDDVPEMLELIAATRPGPFGPRTIEFGGYLGLRVDGRLVAMAGERLRAEGYTEISAVCTLPELRGTGVGTRLVHALVDRIRARGEEAFLHVANDNVNAHRLYLALGFSHRADMDAVIAQAPQQ
jgi:ribosomal protein S18 acetylase RimI-like enzyme